MTTVDEVVSLVRERADDIEHGRRITDDVLAGFRSIGLNRMMAPAELGGDAAKPREVYEIVERISTADGSAGWCAGIGAGSNYFAGILPEDAAREMLSDIDAPSCGVFAPTGTLRIDGNKATLNGRWSFASNCLHSTWIGVGAFASEGDAEPGPIPKFVTLPVSAMTIEDTWDAAGLRGTGSHHVSATDVPVDPRYAITFLDQPWADSPLYRIPTLSALAPLLGITLLGMARGALDEVFRRVTDGVAGQRGKLADDPIGLAELAMADTALRGARANLFDAADEIWDEAATGERVSQRAQARVFLALGHGADVAVDAASTAHRLGGGAAAYSSSPLQRYLRDAITARQHIMFSHGHRGMLAQAIAGVPVFAPPIVI
jgi:alkylation response protein AidB-like acyl-CoA dehydrogenase